jgi:hypothetical protein
MGFREALIEFGSLKGTAFRPSVNAQYEARALARGFLHPGAKAQIEVELLPER